VDLIDAQPKDTRDLSENRRCHQLGSAAANYASVAFPGASDQVVLIERIAGQVADLFRCLVAMEIDGDDVVVSFALDHSSTFEAHIGVVRVQGL